jgi:threonine synthase
VFLATAHPAKFREILARDLGLDVPLPPELEAVRNRPVLSKPLPVSPEALRAELMDGEG